MAIFRMIPDRSGSGDHPQSFIVSQDIMGIPIEWFDEKTSISFQEIKDNDTVLDKLRRIPLSEAFLKQLDDAEQSEANDDDKPWYQQVQMSLICNILYRYAFRIENTNLCDLLLDRDSDGGIVYSVNETSLFSPSKTKLFEGSLTLESKNIIRKWMRIYEREIMTELRKWVKQIQNHQRINEVLSVIDYDIQQLIHSINTLTNFDLVTSLF
jgi:hypothetical protein